MFGQIMGAIGGSLASAGLDLWGQKMAYDRNEDAYKHRYQWMVQDLMKAGLNPMLGYMKDAGGIPGAPSSSVGRDLGNTLTQASTAIAAREQMKAQTENTQADTRNKEAQAALIEAQTYQLRAQGGLQDTQAGQIKSMLPAQLAKATSDAEMAELMLPQARNMSEAEYSEWKKNISPYLEDVLKLSTSASQLSNAFSLTKIFGILDKLRRR